jgi:Ca-activated chloride channel homolog
LLRGLAIAALAVALARPQTVGGKTRINGKGVAIVVALDHSSSMKAADFPADRGTRMIPRLEAAKATFLRFVEGRPDDLVGLITFANLPFMVCPPTPDHAWLVEHAAAVIPARAGDDGTNIGDAIALGIGSLVDLSPTLDKSPQRKVLVLLTDGQNQPAGAYFKDPEQAARLARDWGVILHTIAIGQPGGILRGVDAASQKPTMTEVVGPNLELLESLARITGGISRLAVDTDSLAGIFREIDRLVKSEIHGEVLTRYEEHYARWAALVLGLLICERLLAQGRLRRLP